MTARNRKNLRNLTGAGSFFYGLFIGWARPLYGFFLGSLWEFGLFTAYPWGNHSLMAWHLGHQWPYYVTTIA